MYSNKKSQVVKNSPIYHNTPTKREMKLNKISDENLRKLKQLIMEKMVERRAGDQPIEKETMEEIESLLQMVLNKSQLLGIKTPSEIIEFYIEALCLQRGSGSFIVEKCSFGLLRYFLMCKNEDKDLLQKNSEAIPSLIYLILETVNDNIQLNCKFFF